MAHAEYDTDGLPIIHDEAPPSAPWLPKLGIAIFGVLCALVIVYVAYGVKATGDELTPKIVAPSATAPAAE